MNRKYNQSPYYYNNSNASFDPFSSPRNEQQESVDVFSETPKRRSSGENGSIARAIRNALDPEYNYQQPSMDVFDPSTSSSINYDDDASILAAVSSTHSSQASSSSAQSSQEQNSSQNKISQMFRKSDRKEKSKQTKLSGYASIFQKPPKSSYENDQGMQDFLSPEQIERHRKSLRQRPKQIRMDDYVFKARRVDKGAREFGLHTTHEPKRGSKKKRDSIELLEVEKIDFEKQKQKKQEKMIEQRKSEVEDLDFSLAFGTPSPVRSRPKTSKLTRFFEKDKSRPSGSSNKVADSRPPQNPYNQKPSVFFNDPTKYSNESVLEATFCSTPDKSSLVETVPLDSPILRQITPKRALVQPNPIRRRDFSFEANKERQPLSQPKRQKAMSSNRKPEFDYPSSPITLNDDEDLKIKMEAPPPKRQALREEQEKRKKFGDHVTEREQMIRQLVKDEKFREERENGGIERRRAELQEGQVIRNKEMRKNLMHGAACKCCRGYYDGLEMDENEKKDYINKISRHRYVHQALPDTPERYWDMTLGPRDEEDLEKTMTQQRNWGASIENRQSEASSSSGIRNWN